MIEPTTALVAARFAFDIAALFLWGAGLFAWLLAPGELGTQIWRRLAMARHLATLSIALAVLFMLPTRAAGLGSGWSSALDGSLIWLMLWNTGIGSAWLVQAGGTLLLIGLSAIKKAGSAATAVLAAMLLVSTVLTGHAAMSAGWIKLAHQANSALHVLSAGAWVGALIPLLLVLPKMQGEHSGPARQALVRFSALGHVAVVTVTISGFANAMLILGGLPLNLNSTYQVLLWTKISVVTAMVGLALANRYYFVPQLRSRTGAYQALTLGTLAEIALAIMAVGLVAWFGTLSPMTPG